MEPFSADSLESAFREISAELRFTRTKAHVYIIGGAAIALGFDGRRLTMDVDGIINRGHGQLVNAVRKIARRHDWPENWLNEQAVTALPRGKDSMARTVYADGNLIVTAASAKHLLAMKLRAGRAKDEKDIALLVQRLGMRTARQAWDLHDEVFPGDPPERMAFGASADIMADIWPHDRSMEGDNRYGYKQPGITSNA